MSIPANSVPNPLRRVKITSDGTPLGTKVIDLDTGKDVGAVFEIDWHMDTESAAVATIKTYVQVSVEGRGDVVTVCPRCRDEMQNGNWLAPRDYKRQPTVPDPDMASGYRFEPFL